MLRYKEYFAHLNTEFEVDTHIVQLLRLGYSIDELKDILKVDDDIVVAVIDKFAGEQMKKLSFNKLMEKFGYDERTKTETLFG